jgi:2-C-methyl-D-erythritol 4-phosphate cytidylyltransferase
VTTLNGRRGDVVVLVPAAGAGVRLGSGEPKALRLLGGEPLLMHAVRRLGEARCVGCLVVAAPAGYEPVVRALLASQASVGRQVIVVGGGPQRQQSVAAALAAAPAEFDIVLVHDAARALVPVSLVDDVADAVRNGHDAVVPALPVPDTIIQVDQAGGQVGSLVRSTLRAVQTPQGFRRSVLAAAHRAAAVHAAAPATAGTAATDDAGLVARLGTRVHTIPGSEAAMKITSRRDLALAEALLAQPQPVASPEA